MRRALSLIVLSATAVGLLHVTGDRLAGPALTHPMGWAHWALARPPVEVGMAATRLLALAGAWYLLALGLLATAATLPGLRPLAAVAGALALPALRPLLGVAVAAAPVRAPVPTVTLHRLDPAPAPVVATAPAPHESTWTVARGDSFWSIAVRTIGGAWNRPPTAAEVVPYWSRLVDANRSRLADPARPDLIFAGQVFVVLPPPTRTTDH